MLQIFAQTELYVDDAEYVVVGLTPELAGSTLSSLSSVVQSFLTVVVDKDEVTLVLPWEAWELLSADLKTMKRRGAIA